MTEILQDPHHRQINYLRLSVTDRCNLRCSYCMPADGLPLFKREDLLTRPEIIAIAQVAVQLGIRKIRITGGEPLVRPDIVELLEDLGGIPGLEQLAVTTNGIRLEALAPGLFAAGVKSANISIDSLDPDLYREITRGGDLARCLKGIEASLASGMTTKLNMVVMAGVNDHEIADFVEFSRNRPVAVRFIEYMPTQGSDHAAQNFRVRGAQGSVGVISPVSKHFCDECNRIRITATGLARGCLFHETGLDLKPALRSGDKSELAHALRLVVQKKPGGHFLSERMVTDQAPMSQMGG